MCSDNSFEIIGSLSPLSAGTNAKNVTGISEILDQYNITEPKSSKTMSFVNHEKATQVNSLDRFADDVT